MPDEATPRRCGDTWNGTFPALSADGDAGVYVLRPNGVGVLIDCGVALHGEKDGHLLIFRRERG